MLTGLSGNSGGIESILSLLSLIVIFILVLILTYFATKFIAKYQGNIISSKTNIKVLESFRVANNKFIAIVKIGEGYYAMSIGKDEMHLIDKLNPEELQLTGDACLNDNKIDFNDILSKFKNKNSDDKNDIK